MKLFDRTYQVFMALGLKAIRYPKQELIEGKGSILKIAGLLRKRGLSKPLIVTGPRVSRSDLFARLTGSLGDCSVFDRVEPDPPVKLIAEIVSQYQDEGCDCLIAVGGGSNMDAAKAVAASLARPDRELVKLAGVMKVRKKGPFLVAVPTTAGTGSECTVACVLTDTEHNHKFAVNDPVLLPDAAVRDPDLTKSLPANMVANTGLDALTHAVEAYLNGLYHKHDTNEQCLQAVRDIFTYLPRAYADPSDEEARAKMLKASYLAGQAFTTACVGNIHAIAHTLGGMYHIPHGLANAVLLPVVLEDYGRKAHADLAELAAEVGIEKTDQSRMANRFIRMIYEMNDSMGIPRRFPEIRKEDLDVMAGYAVKEANPLYPVPVIYSEGDVRRILVGISGI